MVVELGKKMEAVEQMNVFFCDQKVLYLKQQNHFIVSYKNTPMFWFFLVPHKHTLFSSLAHILNPRHVFNGLSPERFNHMGQKQTGEGTTTHKCSQMWVHVHSLCALTVVQLGETQRKKDGCPWVFHRKVYQQFPLTVVSIHADIPPGQNKIPPKRTLHKHAHVRTHRCWCILLYVSFTPVYRETGSFWTA